VNIDEIGPIEGHWLGEIRGTHIGNAFLRVYRSNGELISDLRINIQGEVTVFDGRVNAGPPMTIDLVPHVEPGIEIDQSLVGRMTIGNIHTDGFSSEWELSNGARGIAKWIATTVSQGTTTVQTPLVPIRPAQLISKEVPIGAVTIYRTELEGLIQKLKSLCSNDIEPVITATIDNGKVIMYAKDILARGDLPSSVNECTISIADNQPNAQKSIVINFNKQSESNVVVQGPDETWSTGASVDLTEFMKRYTSYGTTAFRKYGLLINAFIFLSAIIVIPDFDIVERVLLIIVIYTVMIAFISLHALVPNTVIYFDDTKRNPFRRQLPTIYSAVLATGIVAVVTILFKYLPVTSWVLWLRDWFGN